MEETKAELQQQLQKLNSRLKEAEETIDAIRRGEVDAFVALASQREKVLMLEGTALPYHVLIQAIGEGALTLSTDGTILYCNNRFAELVKKPSAEVIGIPMSHFVVPADKPEFETLIRRIRKGKQKRKFFLVASDGTQVPALFSACSLEVDNLQAVAVVVTDLTEVIAASKTRLRLASIVESSDDAIIGKIPDGTIVSWNAGAEQLYGYSAQEIMGKPILTLFPTDLTDEWETIRQKVEKRKSIKNLETVRMHKDGRRIAVSVTISPMVDTEGRITGISSIARDITAHKQAEEALQQQLRRTSLFNQITRAIADRQDLSDLFSITLQWLEEMMPLDFGGVFLYDPQALELTSHVWGPKSQSLADELGIGEDTQFPVANFPCQSCLKDETVYKRGIPEEASCISPPLVQRGIRSSVCVPLIIENKVIGVLTVCRHGVDAFSEVEREFLQGLSEHISLAARQTQLYQDLQQAYDELSITQQAILQQERLRALGQMASGIAHDFNNVLSPIIGYSEMLLADEVNLYDIDRVKADLKLINTAASDAANVVNRLREFYRQRGTNEIFHAVDLHRMMTEAVSLTRPKWKDQASAGGRFIDVRTNGTSDLPSIAGNAAELREVLINLILNATDAMPDGGTITLDARPDGQCVLLEVSDTGIGMTEEVQKQCLEPFFTTKEERGTGLGLSMVHGIISRHNGTLAIKSQLGKGTTFRIRLPIWKESDSPAPNTTEGGLSRSLHVLVVEDDPQVSRIITRYLTYDGHTFETAANGREGLQKFHAGRFDLVITDRAMPEINGDQLAAIIKSIAKNKPILMLTGFGAMMNITGEKPDGVDAILSKPVKLGPFLEAIEKVVSS